MESTNGVMHEFDGIYANSKEFPVQAIEQLPKDLLTAIDKGNEFFFQNFESSLPRTYRALLDHCEPVKLLEIKSESRSLASYGEMHYTYRWGAECGGRLLIANIPVVSRNHPIRMINEKKYFSCLPTELHCFYDMIDGMSLADSFTKVGYDFPFSYTSWAELHQYCLNMKTQYLASDKLVEDFPGDDLRVLMRGSRNDLVIINFSKKDGKLYHVHNNEFDNYRVLEDPARTLDKYFANAVEGFPKEILLS